MYQTMTQIGNSYGVDAKTVGRVLYELDIRDANHPEQKGFPHEQAVTHGIAKAFAGRTGDKYYRYDIERIKEEFEAALANVKSEMLEPDKQTQTPQQASSTIETKLEQMLSTLNRVLESGEIGEVHRLKGDIADLYALLGVRTSTS